MVPRLRHSSSPKTFRKKGFNISFSLLMLTLIAPLMSRPRTECCGSHITIWRQLTGIPIQTSKGRILQSEPRNTGREVRVVLALLFAVCWPVAVSLPAELLVLFGWNGWDGWDVWALMPVAVTFKVASRQHHATK